MTHRTAAFVILVALLAARVAAASEQSRALSSRGLVEFHAARYEKAAELFDQAVTADPTDVYARYYRAATRARLDDYEGAIADLRAVLAAQPDLDQAALDLGVALIERKQYREALPWLEQAQRASELAARASLFLGVAHLRMGQLQTARRHFERAATDPEQGLATRYYQGVIDYQEGHWSQAEDHFSYVVGADPASALGREAAIFLARLGQAERRRYRLYGAVGFQYDSNVTLAPSDEDVLDVSGEGDGRFTLSLGASGVAWRSDIAEVSIGYDFFQSLHFDLDEFDLQDHGPSVQIAGQVGRVRLGVVGRYDYYLLDGQSFLQEVTALPWVSFPVGKIGRTELFYRMRRRDYKKQSFSVLNAYVHAMGGRQFFYLGSPDRYVSVGYRFDRVDPVISDRLVSEGVFSKDEAESLAYDGNEVSVGVGGQVSTGISMEIGYTYRHERYLGESALFNPSGFERRCDDEHLVIFALRRQLRDYLSVTAAYLGDFNESSDPRFEYNRHIGSLTLEVSF